MTTKELLLQELEDAAEPLVIKVLDFLRYLKFRQMEDGADIADARAALASAETEGTVTWETPKSEMGL